MHAVYMLKTHATYVCNIEYSRTKSCTKLLPCLKHILFRVSFYKRY